MQSSPEKSKFFNTKYFQNSIIVIQKFRALGTNTAPQHNRNNSPPPLQSKKNRVAKLLACSNNQVFGNSFSTQPCSNLRHPTPFLEKFPLSLIKDEYVFFSKLQIKLKHIIFSQFKRRKKNTKQKYTMHMNYIRY